ncbi:MAG: hypothetical protein HKN14_08235 [Marinicaulis sp.]|nr:hypothetical protein [Marinicaulis sp.]NNL87723.1 hypothetical protein [Marinicaulis sp.]
MKPQFEAQCRFINVEEIENIWLPNAPSKQTQINCFGMEYAGFQRKFEAEFGDDRFALIWIVTTAPAENRIRTALNAASGQPIRVDE